MFRIIIIMKNRPATSVPQDPQPLHQLLGLEEALEMPHLPEADGHQDEGLDDGPPEHALVGALAGLPEALLPVLEHTAATQRRQPPRCTLIGYCVSTCVYSSYQGRA